VSIASRLIPALASECLPWKVTNDSRAYEKFAASVWEEMLDSRCAAGLRRRNLTPFSTFTSEELHLATWLSFQHGVVLNGTHLTESRNSPIFSKIKLKELLIGKKIWPTNSTRTMILSFQIFSQSDNDHKHKYRKLFWKKWSSLLTSAKNFCLQNKILPEENALEMLLIHFFQGFHTAERILRRLAKGWRYGGCIRFVAPYTW